MANCKSSYNPISLGICCEITEPIMNQYNILIPGLATWHLLKKRNSPHFHTMLAGGVRKKNICNLKTPNNNR